MHTVYKAFSVLACASYVVRPSFSLPYTRGRNSLSSEALINCNDIDLLERMEKAAILFRCLPNSDDARFNEISALNDFLDSSGVASAAGNELLRQASKAETNNNNGEKFVSLDGNNVPYTFESETTLSPNVEVDIFTSECTDPLRCSSGKVKPSIRKCPEGHVFISEIGHCHLVELPGAHKPNNQCRTGEVFDSDIGRCLPEDKITIDITDQIASLPTSPSGGGSPKCESGFVFSPETGHCLSVHNQFIPPAHEEIESVVIAFEPPTTGCPKGTIYSPEVDHCMVVETIKEEIPQGGHPEPLALVVDNINKDHGVTIEVGPIGWDKCKEGTIYNPEIDHCLPIPVEIKENGDAPVDVEIQESEKSPVEVILDKSSNSRIKRSPELYPGDDKPIKASIGGDKKCSPEEVYVSEVDLCLTPENPY